MTPGRDSRRASLERAGYNILNLRPDEVAYDLGDDAAKSITASDVRAAALAAIDRRPPDPRDALAATFGADAVHLATGARGIERSLAAVVERPAETSIYTPGLFVTARLAFAERGCRIVVGPAVAGTCTLDPSWLADQLDRATGPAIVHHEACNNELLGRPLALDALAEVRAIAARRGAPHVLDATRWIADRDVAGADAPLAAALDHADLVWLSTGKEWQVAHGGLLAHRHGEALGRVLSLRRIGPDLLLRGTHAAPVVAAMIAASLAAGERRAAEVRGRGGQTDALRTALHGAGIPVLPGHRGHAAYVEVHPVAHELDARRMDAWLFSIGGVRGSMIRRYPPAERHLLRLPLAPGAFSDADVTELVRVVVEAWARQAEAPALRERPGADLSDPWRAFDTEGS